MAGPKPETLEKYKNVVADIEGGSTAQDACKKHGLSPNSYYDLKKVGSKKAGRPKGSKTKTVLRKHKVIDMPIHQPASEKVTVIVCSTNQIKGVMENLR